MAKEKLFNAKDGAFMTRMALATFRTRVSILRIKGRRQGQKVFYTRSQLDDIYTVISAKKGKTVKAKKAAGKKTPKVKR
jgi:hypothetical protein